MAQSTVTVDKGHRGPPAGTSPSASNSLISAAAFPRRQQKSLLGRTDQTLYSSSVIHFRKTCYDGPRYYLIGPFYLFSLMHVLNLKYHMTLNPHCKAKGFILHYSFEDQTNSVPDSVSDSGRQQNILIKKLKQSTNNTCYLTKTTVVSPAATGFAKKIKSHRIMD